MANIKYESIKVKPTVYARLTEAKKSTDTYNDYIEKCLTFFDVTGARPEQLQSHPTLKVLDTLDDIKKIVRSIETKKIDPLIDLVKAGRVVSGVTVDQLEEVSSINENLQNDLKKEKEKTTELQRKYDKLVGEKAAGQEGEAATISAEQGVDVAGIRAALKWLNDSARKNNISNDLIISRTALSEFFEKMESYLKV